MAGGPGRLAAGLSSVGPGFCPGPRQRWPPWIVGAPPPGQGGTRRGRTVDTAAEARGAAACPGRARSLCPVRQQEGGFQYGIPRLLTWKAVFRAPPPSRESSRGSGPRGGGEKAWGKGPCPHTGAYQKRGRRGTDGEAVHYRPSPFHPIATRVESLSLVPLCAGRPHSHCPRPRRPPFPGAAAMASSQSSAVAPTEEMASPSAGRATPAASGTPASATAKSGSPAAGSPWVGEAP